MRFAYAEATVLRLDSNEEFTASVTFDEGVLSWRRVETTDVTEQVAVAHAWAEGKRWYLQDDDGVLRTVRRTGGCGCR